MQDFEKLGVFYLGRRSDQPGEAAPDLLLYESKDLVTHAVCVGMTGSGKTGLCTALLEEAAIDGIPAIVIDPKGDLGNLLLTFPNLNGTDFEPWINAEDARKSGVSPSEFAQQQADAWKAGLAKWGEDGDRIQRLRDSADFTIYTPGSSAGVALSVLKSFAAPAENVREDAEALRDAVSGAVTSLLGLIGVDADPVKSREHILLSSIIAAVWNDGRDLALEELIPLLQKPPMTRVGVMDVDTFFPSKDRFALAMQLNNLLASPGFAAWMQGEPLDVGSLLYTREGKPRMAIISIAHLSDAERMFVVSLLLNQIVSWTRSQPGTTSLRAIVYMDEIFGYFPPVANPPSKQPLLTLLKQARAFGVGVVLATQNPVDLDYKGLSNAGTWFIGRLQTERDKARVLEGLEGAAASASAKFDRGAMEQTLAGLGKRRFLMNNVHDDAPIVFETRWALSYLRGPLTRDDIKKLMSAKRAAPASAPVERAPAATRSSSASASISAPAASTKAGARPVLPPDVPQTFLPVSSPPAAGATLTYQPLLLGAATIHYIDAKLGVDYSREDCWMTAFPESLAGADWPSAEDLNIALDELEDEPGAGALFAEPSPLSSKAKNYAGWKKSLADHLYRSAGLDLYSCEELGCFSQPGESERSFRVRLQQAAREERDKQAAKLRAAYGPKVAALQEKIRKAEQAVARESEQQTSSWLGSAASIGATVLGAFLGRKKLSATTITKATTAARKVGRAAKDSGDVSRAKENVEALQQQLFDLDEKFQADLTALESRTDPIAIPLSTKNVKPKKANIEVQLVALVWAPFWVEKSGASLSAWR